MRRGGGHDHAGDSRADRFQFGGFIAFALLNTLENTHIEGAWIADRISDHVTAIGQVFFHVDGAEGCQFVRRGLDKIDLAAFEAERG